MSRLLPLILVTALAGCTQSMADQPRSPQAQQELDRYLAGKVAGKPESCLNRFRSDDMIVVDEKTFLFRDGSRIWRSDPVGGCSQAGKPGYALLTRHFGSNDICRGEPVRVIDTVTGNTVGVCSFNDFVPYSTAAR